MYGRSIPSIAAVAGWGMVAATLPAQAAVFIDGSNQGLYNAGIGILLDGANPIIDDAGANSFLFPNSDSNPNDPVINAPPEPDLSTAATMLGNWLADPIDPADRGQRRHRLFPAHGPSIRRPRSSTQSIPERLDLKTFPPDLERIMEFSSSSMACFKAGRSGLTRPCSES